MGELVNGFISGYEVNFVKPASGSRLWHYENNFLERGVGFTLFNLDNPKQLGNVYAAYCFFDLPLKTKETPFRLYMRLCPGLAYTPVYFNATENHKNNVVSRPLNAYINFKWFYRWNLSPRWRMEGGLNFSHASNGRSRVPNLGINMVTLNAGLVYKFLASQKTPVTRVDSSSKRVSKNELLAWAAIGFNQVDVLGKVFVAQNYSANYYHNIRNTHKFGGGIEVTYNPANLYTLKADSVKLSSNFQNTQFGVKITYAYNVGRLSLPVEMGYNLYSKFTSDGAFFHRVGMRYYFKNNFVATLTLKSHWAVASFFEFGAGYRIPLKKK